MFKEFGSKRDNSVFVFFIKTYLYIILLRLKSKPNNFSLIDINWNAQLKKRDFWTIKKPRYLVLETNSSFVPCNLYDWLWLSFGFQFWMGGFPVTENKISLHL